VQLKPSTKREMRGFAVEVKRACCVVAGGWTWSKEKTCFLAAVDTVGAAVAFAGPLADCDIEEVASTETLVGVDA
jgi:hypothetical protein